MKKLLIVAASALAVGAVVAVLLVVLSSGSSETIQFPAAPPTAQQVAASLKATGFTDCGPSLLGGVLDSGMAYIGRVKIGIDTFANTAVRNSWEQMAENLGVQPAATGATWVAYKALHQTGSACS